MAHGLRRGFVRVTAVVGMSVMVLALLPVVVVAAGHWDGTTERIAGDDRFGTAARLAEAAYPAGASTVLIANGTTFADALTAAALAGDRDAPLLLTRRDGLPADSRATLHTLAPETVVLLGETAVVSVDVESTLEEDYVVERIGGADRFDTARLIAGAIRSDLGTLPEGGPNGNGGRADLTTAILTTGADFADALAVGALSFAGVHPILLGTRDSLPDATRAALSDDDLAIEQVVILGGPAVISGAVEAELRDDLGLAVLRVGGGDRTETAVRVAELTVAALADFALTRDVDPLAAVNGRAFPDALALAPLAGGRGSVIVLTQTPAAVGPFTLGFVRDNCAGFGADEDPIVVAGGTVAVSAEARTNLSRAAVCEDFVRPGGLDIDPDDAETPVGEGARFTLSGVNGLGEPAAAAPVLVQIFREIPAQPDEPGVRFYREGEGFFGFVQEQSTTLAFDGTVQLMYFNDEPAEDRVIVCGPPDPDEADCVDARGGLVEAKQAAAVAGHTWTGAGGSADDSDLSTSRP